MSHMYVIDQSGTILDFSTAYIVEAEDIPEDASDSEVYQAAQERGVALSEVLQEQVTKGWVESLVDAKITSHEVRVGWISGIIGLLFVFGIIHSIWLVKQLAVG